MAADDDSPRYDVGFGRPPRETRFKKGRSGNPKGRPRGSKNYTTVLEEELRASVAVTENGKRKTISKRRAVAKQLVNRAVSGDLKAISTLHQDERARDSAPVSQGDEHAPLSDVEQLTFEAIVARVRQGAERLEPPEPASPSEADTKPSLPDADPEKPEQ